QQIAFVPVGGKETPDFNVQLKDIVVPETYDSIEFNTEKEKVPYGLKRNLSVKEAGADITEKYYLVIIDGKTEFLKLSDIYYFDTSNKKVTLDKSRKKLENLKVQLYSPKGQLISKIYTEKQFMFTKVNTKEEVDFKNGIKYELQLEVDEHGNVSYKHIGTDKKVEKYFSEQKYVKKEVDDEKNPGKTKTISLIEIKNFEYQPNGEYVAVTINNTVKMVKISDVVDEAGKPIDDMKKMIGKRLSIKVDGKIIATTAPLTYEQAYMTYSTIKNFQESEKEANENSYLRLKNGEYVKEMEVVKPIAYKVVKLNKESYDAFLVKTIGADGKESFVVVSKDYFEKNGNAGELKRENSIRIQRCDINDKDCAIVQTTSKGSQIEQCSVVKKFKFNEATIEPETNAMDTAIKGVMTGYLAGEYLLKDVYHNGSLQELSARRQRYELSDTSLHEDYADNDHQYKSLKINQIRIENGKMVGGPKYSIKNGIGNGFYKLKEIFKEGIGLVAYSGIFVPIVGPVVMSAFVLGSALAIPLIPIVTTIRGIVKNHKRSKFADKSILNRKSQLNELNSRMEKLYERMTSKEYVPYPEARFEDEYSKIVNEIIALSSTSINNNIVVKNGIAEVTPENVNAAKAYMAEFNEVAKQLKYAQILEQEAQKDFEKLDKKMKKLEEKGSVVPEEFQKKYDEAKREYESKKQYSKSLENKREALMNYEGNLTQMQPHPERDRMLKLAEMMHTAVYLKSETFQDHPLVQKAKEDLTDSSDILTTVDLASYVIKEEDLGLTDEDKEKIIQEEISKLPKDEQEKLKNVKQEKSNEYKNNLLDLRINDMLYDKRSQFTEEQIKQMIEENNLTEMVMDDLVLDSNDKKLQKEFAEKKTLEEKIAMIRENEAQKSMKMFDEIEMDFKNGLMVDGMGVGLKYDKDLRQDMSDYGRSHRWEKVKQAVEVVHYGLHKEDEPIVKEETLEEKLDDTNNDENPVEKPTVKKASAKTIAAEESLVQNLEGVEHNDLYKSIMKTLTRKGGSFEMTKEEASVFIFDFTQKVYEAHDKGLSAQSVFEKGSIESKLLSGGIRKLRDLATQNSKTV
ncbi:MAG: hypothetical protein IJ415_02180, partial [Clostridia bacterium]|nr:hypothetical protein [Clostridia bacterium]